MSMNENDWASLSDSWRSRTEGVDAAPLKRIVAAHRRWLLTAAAGELLFFIALVWLTYAVMAGGVTAWKTVWAATLWGFAAIAYAFVWWNRRGTWDAAAESVAEYVRLTRLRARRQLLSLRFGVALLVAESAAAIAQLVVFDRFTALAATALAAAAVAVAVWFVLVRRRIDRDLALAAEFGEE